MELPSEHPSYQGVHGAGVLPCFGWYPALFHRAPPKRGEGESEAARSPSKGFHNIRIAEGLEGVFLTLPWEAVGMPTESTLLPPHPGVGHLEASVPLSKLLCPPPASPEQAAGQDHCRRAGEGTEPTAWSYPRSSRRKLEGQVQPFHMHVHVPGTSQSELSHPALTISSQE